MADKLDWTYSAVRQLTAIPSFQSVDIIANYLRIPIKKARDVVTFLLLTGLCKEENGKLIIGPKSTHLDANSRWLRSHHMNWRQKAIEAIGHEDEGHLQYSAPMTLAARDAIKIRDQIISFLQSVDQIVEPSPSEGLYCLNIDWFKVIG